MSCEITSITSLPAILLVNDHVGMKGIIVKKRSKLISIEAIVDHMKVAMMTSFNAPLVHVQLYMTNLFLDLYHKKYTPAEMSCNTQLAIIVTHAYTTSAEIDSVVKDLIRKGLELKSLIVIMIGEFKKGHPEIISDTTNQIIKNICYVAYNARRVVAGFISGYYSNLLHQLDCGLKEFYNVLLSVDISQRRPNKFEDDVTSIRSSSEIAAPEMSPSNLNEWHCDSKYYYLCGYCGMKCIPFVGIKKRLTCELASCVTPEIFCSNCSSFLDIIAYIPVFPLRPEQKTVYLNQLATLIRDHDLPIEEYALRICRLLRIRNARSAFLDNVLDFTASLSYHI
jgi:hypothetical protein